MGFSSQSYYHAWDILCETYGRSEIIVNAQLKKLHTHPPIRHDNSSSIVKFANVVTNVATWIHLRPRIRRRAKCNNEKTIPANARTVVAVYARSSTTERQLDYCQRVACLQSSNS